MRVLPPRISDPHLLSRVGCPAWLSPGSLIAIVGEAGRVYNKEMPSTLWLPLCCS